MNIENIFKQYDFNLLYTKALVRDLSDAQMTMVPAPGFENHPAWTIGHLISGSASVLQDLGEEFKMPDGWAEIFLRKGPNDSTMPEKDLSKYPLKNELLKEFEVQHEKVKQRLLQTEMSNLNQQLQWRFSNYMPTGYDCIVFMCINHEAMHLGQLAGWRRSMGLPSALATM